MRDKLKERVDRRMNWEISKSKFFERVWESFCPQKLSQLPACHGEWL